MCSKWKPEAGPRPIYIDFQALGSEGYICKSGTFRDIERYGIPLRDGTSVNVYCDDIDDECGDELIAEGVLRRGPHTGWVVRIHPDRIRRLSEEIG